MAIADIDKARNALGALSKAADKKECPDCDGSGKEDDGGQCPTCDGSGKVDNITKAKGDGDCPTCDGEGKIKGGSTTCPTCKGSGDDPGPQATTKAFSNIVGPVFKQDEPNSGSGSVDNAQDFNPWGNSAAVSADASSAPAGHPLGHTGGAGAACPVCGGTMSSQDDGTEQCASCGFDGSFNANGPGGSGGPVDPSSGTSSVSDTSKLTPASGQFSSEPNSGS